MQPETYPDQLQRLHGEILDQGGSSHYLSLLEGKILEEVEMMGGKVAKATGLWFAKIVAEELNRTDVIQFRGGNKSLEQSTHAYARLFAAWVVGNMEEDAPVDEAPREKSLKEVFYTWMIERGFERCSSPTNNGYETCLKTSKGLEIYFFQGRKYGRVDILVPASSKVSHELLGEEGFLSAEKGKKNGDWIWEEEFQLDHIEDPEAKFNEWWEKIQRIHGIIG